MNTALEKVGAFSFYDFDIDARLPAKMSSSRSLLATGGWMDRLALSALYIQRRMVQVWRETESYKRALASAKRLHPNKTMTFPKTKDQRPSPS